MLPFIFKCLNVAEKPIIGFLTAGYDNLPQILTPLSWIWDVITKINYIFAFIFIFLKEIHTS